VTIATAQGPKERRNRRVARITLRITRLEHQAVRVVARDKGMDRGELLRRFLLSQVLEMYAQLTDGK
jgi:hypothetical protein